jgi:hypothetical protein
MLGSLATADDGRPSRQALEQMGLGSLAVLSDEEGLAVRGHGFQSSAMAFGNSFATFNGMGGGSHSQDAYAASGKHFAKGHSFSFAGGLHIGNDTWGGMNGSKWGDARGGKWSGKNGSRWASKNGGKMNGGKMNGSNGRVCCRPCGGHGGKPNGVQHGGGMTKIHSTVVFAGGSSSAFAF